ncbi:MULTISPECIES: urease accessory protein UreE [Sneathiella]|jgi:urease accessory protein|uniref:urease accessory protein UreE n=1 Tax=Sneathiella TaxID=510690 RepID=UPI001469BC96|nr:urease accessory protein UreE [Sneathiella aquimaris]
MIIAYKVLKEEKWPGIPEDQITLEEEDRHRRRLLLKSDAGLEFLLSLEHAERLDHGDGLLLDNGQIIEVLAKPEPLYEVRAKDPLSLMKLAWHLGNRHQQTEIMIDHFRIRQDHVIADMLKGLGADVTEIEAPFSPVIGAYAKKHEH